jgi:hypothetical protein
MSSSNFENCCALRVDESEFMIAETSLRMFAAIADSRWKQGVAAASGANAVQ